MELGTMGSGVRLKSSRVPIGEIRVRNNNSGQTDSPNRETEGHWKHIKSLQSDSIYKSPTTGMAGGWVVRVVIKVMVIWIKSQM